MKTVAILFFMLLGGLSLQAQESLAGIWNTGQENTTVEIKQAGNDWSGKIHASDNPKAPLGTLMIKEVKKDKKGYKGKLYSIKKDRWVDAYFEPQGDTLSITISVAWQKKSLAWTREKS
ncbi:MAG: hypothetical protein AAF206_06605 [Bacteroidota bacterium]